MNSTTKSKMDEIIAAAKNKSAVAGNKPVQKISAAPAPIETPAPVTPAPETPAETTLAKLVSFTIIWQEGSGKYDGKVFDTWAAANKAMTAIFNEHSGLGYLKVKINVKWANGAEITDRADCSDSAGDFNPKRGTIGEYLKKQKGVMYASNLQQGDRLKSISFEDETTIQDEPKPIEPAKCNPCTFSFAPITAAPELSTITVSDLLNEPKQAQKSKLQIVDYSEKAFAIVGETKEIKDQLTQLGGKFNLYLKCGAGWIFSKKRLDAVKVALSL